MKKEEIFYKKGYRVTNEGNIMSPSGRVLAKSLNSCGYYKISCRCKGKHIQCSAHRLQAFQKYNNKLFDSGIEVRHKNGISTDNSFENILIGTHSQNMMDIPESIRISKALYATSFIRKYDKEKVRKFHFNNGNSYKKTMNEFNISSKGTLHYILKSKK